MVCHPPEGLRRRIAAAIVRDDERSLHETTPARVARSPHTFEVDDDILETLRSSHGRIGTVLARAAVVADASAPDAAAAAPHVVRALTMSVALHVRDHADTLTPRLRARCSTLDRALARIVVDHRRALAIVRRMHASSEWEPAVLELGYLFVSSFALEEDAIFPAVVQRLSREERHTVVREMRMRRTPRISAMPTRQVRGKSGDRDGVVEQPWAGGGSGASSSLIPLELLGG
jgi:hypothetical protein